MFVFQVPEEICSLEPTEECKNVTIRYETLIQHWCCMSEWYNNHNIFIDTPYYALILTIVSAFPTWYPRRSVEWFLRKSVKQSSSIQPNPRWDHPLHCCWFVTFDYVSENRACQVLYESGDWCSQTCCYCWWLWWWLWRLCWWRCWESSAGAKK